MTSGPAVALDEWQDVPCEECGCYARVYSPTGERICATCEAAPIAIGLEEFLSREFPPREWVVPGLLQEKDLGMVHSFRGVGKTYFALGVAFAVASASSFLRYDAPQRPRGVLIVDGEMPREELQKRLLELVANSENEVQAPFKILATDMLIDPFPSLATKEGQALVAANLDGVDLIVLDNISTLCAHGNENEADNWEPLQVWLLSLRRQGYTVLLVHHDGKGGSQRGTSKREDVLSQVIQLRRPADYDPKSGAKFEVHLTKARGVSGKAAGPFEAELRSDGNGCSEWIWRPLEDAKRRQVLALYQDGVTNQRDIAKETGFGLGTVNRKIKELRAEGTIT